MNIVFLGSTLFCLTSCQQYGENICANNGSERERRCCLNFFEYDGKCVACRNGTFGVNCSEECPPGHYGYLCESRCDCSSRQVCLAAYGCRGIETELSIKNSASNGTTLDLESTGKHYIVIVIGSSVLGLLCIVSIIICIIKSCININRKDKYQAGTTPSDTNDVDRLNCTLSGQNNQSISENASGQYDHLELRLRNVNFESLDSVVDQANGEASNAYDMGTPKPCDLHREQDMRDQSQLEMKSGKFENYYLNGNRDSDSVETHADFTCVRRLSDDGNFCRQSKSEIQQAEPNNEILYGNALECEDVQSKAGISPTSETTKYDLQHAEANNEILYGNALECEEVKNKAGVLSSSETTKYDLQEAEASNEILYGNALECQKVKNKAGVLPSSETTKYDLQEAEASNEILYGNALECQKVKNKEGVLPSSETTKYDLQNEKVIVSCKDIKLMSRRQDVDSLCLCVDDDHLINGESPYINFD